ncbi:hypothetical protein [Nocardia cyriacigeorgica]|uniref:hypothetical protein n=1 Tax=Nocardia cyriacigeorgica TaxID=135487 RepID=UPI002016B661|nr:hypothetical protein [Nocardia cyriacigeorgica]
MTATAEPDGLAEFAAELKLLAEAVLERVEPVLRRAAADGKPEWDNCSWCPVCAAAALVRGEQHDVLSAIADHGTAIVTVLREALAGVPVEPVMPDGTEPGVRHRHHGRPEGATRAPGATAHGSQAESERAGSFDGAGDLVDGAGSPGAPTDDTPTERSRLRRAKPDGRRRSRTSTPADAVRDDIRSGGTPAGSAPAPDADPAAGAGETGRSAARAGRSGAQGPRAGTRSGARDSDTGTGTASQPGARSGRPESPEGKRTRSRYVGIPVTIKT